MNTEVIKDFFNNKKEISYKEATGQNLIVTHAKTDPFELLTLALRSEIPSEPNFYSEISVGINKEDVALIIRRETKDKTKFAKIEFFLEFEKAQALHYLLGRVLYPEDYL